MKWVIITALSLLIIVVGSLVAMARYDARNQSERLSVAKQAVEADTTAPVVKSLSSRAVSVPILMYHYIRDYQSETDQLGVQLSVTPQAFRRQLQSLRQAGYETISLSEFAAGRLPSQPIILTFDDGYVDHYQNALPILQESGYTGTFFIVSDFVGRDGYMDESQVTNLKLAGMEVGGHSTLHKNLTRLDFEAAIKDIAESLVGREPVFSYPAGHYSYETLDIVSGLGLKAAVTTEPGVASTDSNLYELPRIRVKEATNILRRIAELKNVKVPSKASQPIEGELELLE